MITQLSNSEMDRHLMDWRNKWKWKTTYKIITLFLSDLEKCETNKLLQNRWEITNSDAFDCTNICTVSMFMVFIIIIYGNYAFF